MGDGTVSEERMIELMKEIRKARVDLNNTTGLIRNKAKSTGKRIARIGLFFGAGLVFLLIMRTVLCFFGHSKR